MKVPVSWLKDFVDITLPIEELAERLTLASLEVASIRRIGVPGADLEWDRDKLILGHILRVEPHPNADRLVLATVDIGAAEPETVVTGATNLFEYLGQGDISHLNLKSPFVLEGAQVYDGYAKEPGAKMTLKGREIRGIMNRHMLCSEKELGISDEHGGIILASAEEAPPGTPVVDLWGDVVLDIDLTPNLIRCASIIGVAREVAALTGQKLRYPDTTLHATATLPITDRLSIRTIEPDLNPRFVAVLIEGLTIKPSPYWMQRRLRMAGMRPINNIVDISNYAMLEVGQPNHAFDWDVLQRRAEEYGGPVQIITRLAEPGEKLLTLDDKWHEMPDYSILVTDPKGNLSIGGIMGGAESEVSEESHSILLEAAAWNFSNIRRTGQALNIYSEAGYRLSRGIHPAQAMVGAKRTARLMAELIEGATVEGVLDYYPQPPDPVTVDLPQAEVTRLLGTEISLTEIEQILTGLEFEVEQLQPDFETKSPVLRVTVPDHRMDISAETVAGQADLIEEIARVYGYDRLPVTEISDELPPQRDYPLFDREEQVRDLLVGVGLQEIISYRLTTPEGEARLLGEEDPATYVTLANPTTPDRRVMRHSLLNSVLEAVAENSKNRSRVQLFEVGHIYLLGDEVLPEEKPRLAIALTGPREEAGWLPADREPVDFFDLKGVVEALLDGLYIRGAAFVPAKDRAYHPGRVAELTVEGQAVGLVGQLHPLVVEAYDIQVDETQPVLAADLDLAALLAYVPEMYVVKSVPRFPAVQQDIAVVVDEAVPAEQVEALILQTGQPLLVEARLFDLYRGQSIAAGKKSLAYSLTFQAEDRTLTDKVVAKQQNKIVRRLEKELGAKLRS